MSKQTTIITFKEVRRDSFPDPFIEATAGRPKARKGNSDTVEWNIVNHTTVDLEVAVVDFYADKGGTPFASGFVPEPSGTVIKKNGNVPGPGKINKIKDQNGAVQPGPNTSIPADGDIAIYKYTVLARTAAIAGTPPIPAGPWFLVRDPEMEIEP